MHLRKVTPGIRFILYVASGLVLSVGLSLFLLSEQTDIYFSWTINPPLTAAFLGAGYLASFLLEFLSARRSIWAQARPAVPGVWLFTLLTLIVTLVHLDRFHFGSPQFITAAGTWVWLGVYIAVPVALGILWAGQIRQPGSDPGRKAPLPTWIRTTLIIQGAVMFLLGAAMLLLPKAVIPHWPWALSPLTSRAIGAWGVGIGTSTLQAVWENDWWRLSPGMASYALYGALQLINLLRYPALLDYTTLPAALYTFFMITVMLIGCYGFLAARRANSMPAS